MPVGMPRAQNYVFGLQGLMTICGNYFYVDQHDSHCCFFCDKEVFGKQFFSDPLCLRQKVCCVKTSTAVGNDDLFKGGGKLYQYSPRGETYFADTILQKRERMRKIPRMTSLTTYQLDQESKMKYPFCVTTRPRFSLTFSCFTK